MFNTNLNITGRHANYLKDLCELRANVPDKDQHTNFKIFKSYVDAYVVCPLIGYQYGRRVPMESNKEIIPAGIMAEQIIKRSRELKFVYEILMLVDEDSEPDPERRVYRTFRLSEANEEDLPMIEENLRIFNEYFLGGIEVLYEQFVQECIDQDQYLLKMYQYTKKFYEEQDGEALKASIDSFLNV